MRETTATYTAMLKIAGFDNEDALYTAMADTNGDAATRRITQKLANAFINLETAERQMSRELADTARYAADAQAKLAAGQQVDAAWMVSSANKAAEAYSQMQAAIEAIKTMTWIRDGQLGK